MSPTSLRSTFALLLLGAALVLPSFASGNASTCVYPFTVSVPAVPATGLVGQPWTASSTGGSSPWCTGAPPAFDAPGASCTGAALTAVPGAWCDAVVFAAPPPGALPPPKTCTAYPSTTPGSGAFVTLSGVMAGWDVAGPNPLKPAPMPTPATPPGSVAVGPPDGNLDGWDLYWAGPAQGGIVNTGAGPGGSYTADGIYPPMFGPAGWAQLIAYPIASYAPPVGFLPAPTIAIGCA